MRILNILFALLPVCMSCCRADLWQSYLEVPAGYVSGHCAMLQKTYSFDEFDAELLLQRNGPDTYQRVLKVFPKHMAGKCPAVVVPFYFPEAMIGFELDDRKSLPKYDGIEMMLHLVRRGFVCISADSYHLTYVENSRPRDDFARWQDAGEALTNDFPQWCGIGKLVSDTRLLIDLLEQDIRVDADRIGIAGHSLGGKMAFYTGCLDTRIKAILASDFGFLWEQSNWEKVWYWGDKLESLKECGLDNSDLLSRSGGKPFFLIAGQFDTDESYLAMQQAGVYSDFPERLGFLNHATGHRPPSYALAAGYDFLEKYLNM